MQARMDSANSGSLQSSSGGEDDDFDAVDSSSPLSALLRHPPPSPSPVPCFGGAGASLIYGLQELATPPPLSRWCPTTAPLQPTSYGAAASASPPSLHCHDGGLAAASGEAEADNTALAPTTGQPAPAAPPRGSRKRARARASRRAPTTVLTTDTSNFRAMVQEFTGIPAPPFAAAPGARCSRFDHLFPSRPYAAAAALPEYLLRPFAHKLHHASSYPPPFNSPASTSPAKDVAIAAPAASAPGATAAVAHGESYQQLTTSAAPPAIVGMQDHTHTSNSCYLSFQSTLGAHLNGGDAKSSSSYPTFDRVVAPPPAPTTVQQDQTDFLGLAQGIMMSSESEGKHLHLQPHPRNGDDRGHELSGLVGGGGGCKATIYSSAPPLVERNGRSPPAGVSTDTTTAAMRTRQQGVDSWVCSTSE